MSSTGKPRKPKRGYQAPGVGQHVNAEDILPEDLLRSVQVYFRGGRLYVPSPGWNLARDDAICQAWKEMREEGKPAKWIDGELGSKFGLSSRRIQQITSEGGLRQSPKSKRKKSQ